MIYKEEASHASSAPFTTSKLRWGTGLTMDQGGVFVCVDSFMCVTSCDSGCHMWVSVILNHTNDFGAILNVHSCVRDSFMCDLMWEWVPYMSECHIESHEWLRCHFECAFVCVAWVIHVCDFMLERVPYVSWCLIECGHGTLTYEMTCEWVWSHVWPSMMSHMNECMRQVTHEVTYRRVWSYIWMSMMKPSMNEYQVAIQRAQTRSADARQVRNAHERDRKWKLSVEALFRSTVHVEKCSFRLTSRSRRRAASGGYSNSSIDFVRFSIQTKHV